MTERYVIKRIILREKEVKLRDDVRCIALNTSFLQRVSVASFGKGLAITNGSPSIFQFRLEIRFNIPHIVSLMFFCLRKLLHVFSGFLRQFCTWPTNSKCRDCP